MNLTIGRKLPIVQQTERHKNNHPAVTGHRLLALRILQLRRNLVRLLELRARFRLFSFLMKGQCKIIVGLPHNLA